MDTTIRTLLSVALSTLVIAACGARKSDLPGVESTPIASQAELDRLKKQKKANDDSLSQEQSATSEQLSRLQADIDKLNEQLKSSQEMSLEERRKLQAQLEEAKRQREAAEQRQKELAAKTSSPSTPTAGGTVVTTTGTGSTTPTSGSQAPTTTSSPASPSTRPNPTAPTNNIGTPSTTKHAIFYATDCLAVGDNSTTEGALVYARPCNNASSQTLSFERLDNNTYRFVFQNSQKCLYVQGASSSDGAALQQISCRRNGDTSELFQFADPPNSFDFKLRNVRSGLCLKIGNDGKIFQSNCTTNYTIFRWRQIP
jgi:TolA-binding protein